MEFHPAVQPAATRSAAAWCFAFVDGQLLVLDGESPTLLPVSDGPVLTEAMARHYLGRCDGLDCWALRLDTVPSGWRGMPLRAAMMAFAPPLMALAGRAAQVLEWDRAHRFCGVCGTPTELQPQERARRCPACGHTAYPRLSPSMMALVWREGELLLARSPHFAKGMYSALAGFVEAGESIEDCVVREVAEEVGVRITDLRYYGSQSWPFPHSLMVAFTARWVAGEIVPQAGEIEHAAWFTPDALPGIPPRFSIAGHLIRDTLAAMAEGRWS
ncbi:NAD(+) diphosphatase [Aquabacterium sp.]|uniref:NAD(+) diphosphatase n=1 Tax=Aquabacterium sp. TaxID=1872578 RepID=UPI002BAD9871|nr:NAD(+) diphosphatase [Aquabacterium sp.]HSW04780.1 NAD(+) diphosphatase [Aquabacterium sp.]